MITMLIMNQFLRDFTSESLKTYTVKQLKFIYKFYKLISRQMPRYFNQNLLVLNTQPHQHPTRARTNGFLNYNSPE